MKSGRFLYFKLGDESYALPLLDVKEVIAMPEVTPIPQSPTYFLGIMNLRGQVISVMDLRAKLGIKYDKNESVTVIICEFASFQIGVVVNSVENVVTLNENEVSPSTDIQNARKTEYISGVAQKDNKSLLILDIAKALDVTDVKIVQGQQQPKAA